MCVFSEVQSMINPNDKTPSSQYTNLLALIESIRKKTTDMEKIWGKRRVRVELFVQIKHFEMHSREVSSEEAKKKKKEDFITKCPSKFLR